MYECACASVLLYTVLCVKIKSNSEVSTDQVRVHKVQHQVGEVVGPRGKVREKMVKSK